MNDIQTYAAQPNQRETQPVPTHELTFLTDAVLPFTSASSRRVREGGRSSLSEIALAIKLPKPIAQISDRQAVALGSRSATSREVIVLLKPHGQRLLVPGGSFHLV